MSASQIASAVVTVFTILLSLAYIVGLYLLRRYSNQHPKALNRLSSLHLQRYAPVVWVFLIFSSIVEIAVSVWLLAVYKNTKTYPNVEAWNGIILCLFSACWTMLFSSIYIVLFVHPTLSKHPAVSIGSQSVWVIVTWSFWVACTATVNGSLPMATSGICLGIAYCGQLQALFAFSLIEMLTLTLSMLVLAFLLWKRARETLNTPLPR